MSQVMAEGRRFFLALATIVFFIFYTKLFNSRFLFCSLAKIEDFMLFRKYLSIIGVIGGPIGS